MIAIFVFFISLAQAIPFANLTLISLIVRDLGCMLSPICALRDIEQATDCTYSPGQLWCDANGDITKLYLPGQQMVGFLSTLIGRLGTLADLTLSDNNLSGTLTFELT